MFGRALREVLASSIIIESLGTLPQVSACGARHTKNAKEGKLWIDDTSLK